MIHPVLASPKEKRKEKNCLSFCENEKVTNSYLSPPHPNPAFLLIPINDYDLLGALHDTWIIVYWYSLTSRAFTMVFSGPWASGGVKLVGFEGTTLAGWHVVRGIVLRITPRGRAERRASYRIRLGIQHSTEASEVSAWDGKDVPSLLEMRMWMKMWRCCLASRTFAKTAHHIYSFLSGSFSPLEFFSSQ